MKKNILQYIVYILLLLFSIIVVLTGIIKFPGLLNILQVNNFALPMGVFTFLHDWIGLALTVISIFHIILNWKWIQGMTKKLFKKPVFPFVALIAILFGLVFSISLIDRNDVQIENMQPETDISFKAGDANNEVPLDSTLPKA